MRKELFGWLSIGSRIPIKPRYGSSWFFRRPRLCKDGQTLQRAAIMLEMDNVPFLPSKPAKQAYTWRDIQRKAQKYNLPIPQSPVA